MATMRVPTISRSGWVSTVPCILTVLGSKGVISAISRVRKGTVVDLQLRSVRGAGRVRAGDARQTIAAKKVLVCGEGMLVGRKVTPSTAGRLITVVPSFCVQTGCNEPLAPCSLLWFSTLTSC